MKLGIMQPYFFPYLGYFDLIYRTDEWVFFDIVQYRPKSWMNRNRILHPNKGWQYVNIPVNHSRGMLIKDIALIDKNSAHQRIIGQLNHYRKKAPYYKKAIQLVNRAFTEINTDSLTDLNIQSLKVVCDYLDINIVGTKCSEIELNLQNIDHPGKWALEISRQLGADEYINPIGGEAIFRPDEWKANDIKLTLTPPPLLTYDCSPFQFVEHLSIIDILMWNSPEDVKLVLGK